ncbi:MAG: RHS repeat-associated core domain-containing protein [Candidatus Methanosuratincola sp.]
MQAITYTYDPLHRLTGAAYSTGERYEYAYDAVGNRTAYTETTPLAGTTVTTYTYDAANRLLVSVSPGHPITYTWDARGDLTGDGTFTYAYNAAGRLVRAQSITATLIYTYTADGLRVGQSTNGTLTTYAWDWASPVPELLAQSTGSQSTPYLLGHETLGWAEGGGWRYVLPDALGSVRQVADGAGTVAAVREWEPYGVEVGGWQAGLGYTGEWQDAAVGLVYLRARWLDTATGRFTQRDRWEGDRRQPVTLQPYLYVNDNPTTYVDPEGLAPVPPLPPIPPPPLPPIPLVDLCTALRLPNLGYYEDLGWAVAIGLGVPGFGVFEPSDLPTVQTWYGEALAHSYNMIFGGIQIAYDYRHMQSAVFHYLGVGWDPLQLIGVEGIYGQGFLWGFTSGVADYGGIAMNWGIGLGGTAPVLGPVSFEGGIAGVLSIPLSEQGEIMRTGVYGVGWSMAAELGVSMPLPIEEGGGNFEIARYVMEPSTFRTYNSATEMSQAILNSGIALIAYAYQDIGGIPPELTQLALMLVDQPIAKPHFGLRMGAAMLPYLYEMMNEQLGW